MIVMISPASSQNKTTNKNTTKEIDHRQAVSPKRNYKNKRKRIKIEADKYL